MYHEYTDFFGLKNRADHESTLSTNYCFLLVLTLLIFCICFCCSNFCCKMMFFSFSAMYFSAKCKIKSQLFNISPPFPPFRKSYLSCSVRLLILYNIYTYKTSEQCKFLLILEDENNRICHFSSAGQSTALVMRGSPVRIWEVAPL